MFKITDDGIGIPEDKLPEIFNINSDQSGNNWDGTGLGLSICRNVATEINARIRYASKPNKGTVFEI